MTRYRWTSGRLLLWRQAEDGSTLLQAGLAPEKAVLLDNLDPILAAQLSLLEERTEHQLETAHPRPELVTSTLRRLRRAGVIEPVDVEQTHRHQRAASRVVVHGLGPVGVAVARLLADAGIGEIALCDSGTIGPGELVGGLGESDLGTPRAPAVRELLRRDRPKLRLPLRCEPAEADAVVVCDRPVVGTELAMALVADRCLHLPAHAAEGHACVGPVVFPGWSSCLRCAQLHRAERDPHWYALTEHLSAVVAAPPGPAAAAASLAVEQLLLALRWPQGSTAAPQLWQRSLEWDPRGAEMRSRHRPPHPDCGCGSGQSDHGEYTEPAP